MEINNYLKQPQIIQLATTSNGKPWVVSVYFVADEQHDIYWLSFPMRRHSVELAGNAYAAVTMAIKVDTPVVGLSAEGTVSIVEESGTVETIMRAYVAKYGAGHKFHENFSKGVNKHVMYKLTVSKFTLFDELNFSQEEARQEIVNENN